MKFASLAFLAMEDKVLDSEMQSACIMEIKGSPCKRTFAASNGMLVGRKKSLVVKVVKLGFSFSFNFNILSRFFVLPVW